MLWLRFSSSSSETQPEHVLAVETSCGRACGGHALAAFQFFEFCIDARHARHQADQRAGHIGAQALLFEEAGIVGLGFGRGQREIEITHRDYLPVFWIGYAYEYSNRFLNPAQLALFG